MDVSNPRTRQDLPVERRREIEIEQGLDNLAHYLDGLFRVPGTTWRFGLDGLIGLVPNVGDTITSFASFYILLAGVRYGVPKITLLRMAFNIGIDYVVGAIPFLGDAFDFIWKSNKKNMALIRERATGTDKGTKTDYLFVFAIIGLLVLLLLGSIFVSLYIIGSIFWEIFTGNI
ncbi:MAG TPA: DUF4112 domain-containing protein [Pyrinomonadaceae bacterium]|nr:DUF4112 domain-containing protein [Pyrinomonadaceae bacterium]HMP65466.1 DUF4112 domain-containing protein [Pyrinomonadaceae bacterium]